MIRLRAPAGPRHQTAGTTRDRPASIGLPAPYQPTRLIAPATRPIQSRIRRSFSRAPSGESAECPAASWTLRNHGSPQHLVPAANPFLRWNQIRCVTCRTHWRKGVSSNRTERSPVAARLESVLTRHSSRLANEPFPMYTVWEAGPRLGSRQFAGTNVKAIDSSSQLRLDDVP